MLADAASAERGVLVLHICEWMPTLPAAFMPLMIVSRPVISHAGRSGPEPKKGNGYRLVPMLRSSHHAFARRHAVSSCVPDVRLCAGPAAVDTVRHATARLPSRWDTVAMAI